MQKLQKIITRLLTRISPEVASNFTSACGEVNVARVHKRGIRKCQEEHAGAQNLRINFGSGRAPKEGFLNLDFSHEADIRLDLRKSIPLPDACAEITYSEHFLEHLSYPEGATLFLSECFRLLRPGGLFAVSVPDTEWPLRAFASGDNTYLVACKEHGWHPADCDTFMEHLNYHFRQRWTGCSYDHFEVHRFAWDYETMQKKLVEAGFVEVDRRDFDPLLDSAHRRVGSLFVGATKPGSISDNDL